MFKTNKKNIIFLSGSLLIAGLLIGSLVWYVGFYQPADLNDQTEQQLFPQASENQTDQPVSQSAINTKENLDPQQQLIRVVHSEPVIDFMVGNFDIRNFLPEMVFIDQTGKIFQFTGAWLITKLPLEALANIKKIAGLRPTNSGFKIYLSRHDNQQSELLDINIANQQADLFAKIEAVKPNINQVANLSDGRLLSLESLLGDTYAYTNTDGSIKKQLFRLPLTDWLIKGVTANDIYLQSKSQADNSGWLYQVKISDGTYKKVLGDLKGLEVTINPPATIIVGTYYTNGQAESFAYYPKTNKTEKLSYLVNNEKCAWNKTGDNLWCFIPKQKTSFHPGFWRQGLIENTDDLIMLSWDNQNLVGSESFAWVTTNDQIDAIKTAIKENKLFFLNNKDYLLYGLDLSELMSRY